MSSTGSSDLSIYDDRRVTVEVTGLHRQGSMQAGAYTLKVPYRSLAQTIQSISRKGGKVVGVTVCTAEGQARKSPQRAAGSGMSETLKPSLSSSTAPSSLSAAKSVAVNEVKPIQPPPEVNKVGPPPEVREAQPPAKVSEVELAQPSPEVSKVEPPPEVSEAEPAQSSPEPAASESPKPLHRIKAFLEQMGFPPPEGS